jgi:HEAT repeat protein
VIKGHCGMSTGTTGGGDSQSESSIVNTKKTRNSGRGLRPLLMLILGCAVIFWAWRIGWDARYPVLAAARKLRSSDASQRLAAIQEVSDLGTSGTSEALQPLTLALADQDATVRRAAAKALGDVGSLAAKAGTKSDALREAAHRLIGALQDPVPSVRIAASVPSGS